MKAPPNGNAYDYQYYLWSLVPISVSPRSDGNTTCDEATAKTTNDNTGISATEDADADIDAELGVNADTNMMMALFQSKCNHYYKGKNPFGVAIDDRMKDSMKADAVVHPEPSLA